MIEQNTLKPKFIYAIVEVASIFKRNKKFFLQFFTGQFLLQFFNLLNGFFLLRWLPVTEQAKFSVAFSIQTLIITLSDLGFTGSIIALTGTRINNKEVIGSYIKSAKHLRNYLFLFSCLLTLILLPFIIKKQSWGYLELFIILVPVLLSVFWQADASLYDSTLVMHKKMKELYKPQVGIAALKLTTNYVLYFTNIIGALSTLVINAISFCLTAKFFKKKAKPFIDLTNRNVAVQQKEMLQYLKPLFPSLIFNALFGQVQIFLISFFGKDTNIAEVAALGRLSQLFIFLSSVNAVVVGPIIAKSDEKDLFKKVLLILGFTLLIAFSVFSISIFVPQLFLYLLGPKYVHLKSVLPIAILSSCITYISGVIWTINSARKWLFWWATATYISSIVICQSIGIIFINLSSTLGVLILSLLTSVVILLVQISITFEGFRKRKLMLGTIY